LRQLYCRKEHHYYILHQIDSGYKHNKYLLYNSDFTSLKNNTNGNDKIHGLLQSWVFGMTAHYKLVFTLKVSKHRFVWFGYGLSPKGSSVGTWSQVCQNFIKHCGLIEGG
jgi:hypothetical protein